MSDGSRIRGRQLQRIRHRWFGMHPLCALCKAEGKVVLAVELDHVVALVNGGPDFDADEGANRQGLCAACHADKTRVDRGHGPSSAVDASGWPTDPRHPWNAV